MPRFAKVAQSSGKLRLVSWILSLDKAIESKRLRSGKLRNEGIGFINVRLGGDRLRLEDGGTFGAAGDDGEGGGSAAGFWVERAEIGGAVFGLRWV